MIDMIHLSFADYARNCPAYIAKIAGVCCPRLEISARPRLARPSESEIR